MKKSTDQGLRKSTARGTLDPKPRKRIPASFFRTATGNEPVREWLRAMSREDRGQIGEDIRIVEYGWPIGMPVCRSMGDGLHEVRSTLPGGRIARVFFYVDQRQRMILLHGIIKKSQESPTKDLELARSNKRTHERGLQ